MTRSTTLLTLALACAGLLLAEGGLTPLASHKAAPEALAAPQGDEPETAEAKAQAE